MRLTLGKGQIWGILGVFHELFQWFTLGKLLQFCNTLKMVLFLVDAMLSHVIMYYRNLGADHA